mgnify:CR=1 FL=1
MIPQTALRRLRAVVAAVLTAACSTLSWAMAGDSALAAPAAGDAHIVIDEVYGGGGNAGAPYTNDFVELFNPTARNVDLGGWTLRYYSASGNLGNSCTLTGTLAPAGYFLVQEAAGAGAGEALPTSEATCPASLSASKGTVELADASGSTIDLVGYGATKRFEGAAAAPALGNTTAAQRVDHRDTDQNGADFTAVAPAPHAGSSGSPSGPDSPTPPAVTDTPIAAIQGSGDSSPLVGRQVTTVGVVTADYPTGGFNGFYLQTPGTGNTEKKPGDASDGVFVYGSSIASDVRTGDCYRISGTVSEFNGLTELNDPKVMATLSCAPVTPVKLADFPGSDAAKEAYEGMLVAPQGDYTITNNYALNQFGQLGLAVGDSPLRQATDVVRPGTAAQAYESDNLTRLMTLDDGSSWNYLTNSAAQNSPLPYLSQETPRRTGSHVQFTEPVILDYRYGWNFQPTGQVVGAHSSFVPISSQDTRDEHVPAVGGEVKLGSFNVLNYFPDLGQDEPGCTAYTDRTGVPISAKDCTVRGAYSPAAFADQQTKIVSAIDTLDVDVLALQEIENPAQVGWSGHGRDAAVADLVAALNKAAGTTRWAYLPSPAEVPAGEDVIRPAFIYNPATISPVGASSILTSSAFDNARNPLAQEFTVTRSGLSFVAIDNHFKSKGSGVDDGTGQGLANPDRVAQAKALTSWATSTFADKPVFLLGDFNSYSREDPVETIEKAGFTSLIPQADTSYQYSGRMGSLDHVFGNARAAALVSAGAHWHINADESIAMEYDRRNENVTDFFAPGPFRSSDHDPSVVGLVTSNASAVPPASSAAPHSPSSSPSQAEQLPGSPAASANPATPLAHSTPVPTRTAADHRAGAGLPFTGGEGGAAVASALAMAALAAFGARRRRR